MATVDAYAPLNMVNPGYISGTIEQTTDTRIIIQDGDFEYDFLGQGFTFNDTDVTGGTFTAFAEFQGDTLLGQASGFAIPAPLAANYILAGDTAGLFSVALTGDDQINGSIFADQLRGFLGNDTIDGNGGNDSIFGDAGNDIISGGAGQNYLDGGAGLDAAVYDDAQSAYRIIHEGDQITVASAVSSGHDTTVSVERFAFADSTVAFDSNAAQGYRLYQAAFDRTPDQSGLSFWVSAIDHGEVLHDVAGSFIASEEFQSLYGANPSDEGFVQLLYQNVLDRDPDAGGYAYWTDRIDSGLSRNDVLVAFSESAENQMHVAGVVDAGITLDAGLVA